MAKSIRINITIDEETLNKIDNEVARLHTNRSQFITDSCLSKIFEREQIELIRSNPQVYRDMIFTMADGLREEGQQGKP